MKRQNYEQIPTTLINEDVEEGKYTTLYTDVWTFELFLPLEELLTQINNCKKNKELFKNKKLEEYSQVMEHFWELVLDLEQIKILWYKEHHIIDNLKKRKELNIGNNLNDKI